MEVPTFLNQFDIKVFGAEFVVRPWIVKKYSVYPGCGYHHGIGSFIILVHAYSRGVAAAFEDFFHDASELIVADTCRETDFRSEFF